jgi:hypothetical protein
MGRAGPIRADSLRMPLSAGRPTVWPVGWAGCCGRRWRRCPTPSRRRHPRGPCRRTSSRRPIRTCSCRRPRGAAGRGRRCAAWSVFMAASPPRWLAASLVTRSARAVLRAPQRPTKPSVRLPSAQIRVGVPWTPSWWASARLRAIGWSQAASVLSALVVAVQHQALPGTLRDRRRTRWRSACALRPGNGTRKV